MILKFNRFKTLKNVIIERNKAQKFNKIKDGVIDIKWNPMHIMPYDEDKYIDIVYNYYKFCSI